MWIICRENIYLVQGFGGWRSTECVVGLPGATLTASHSVAEDRIKSMDQRKRSQRKTGRQMTKGRQRPGLCSHSSYISKQLWGPTWAMFVSSEDLHPCPENLALSATLETSPCLLTRHTKDQASEYEPLG